MGVSHMLEHLVFKGTREPEREGHRARRSNRSAARSTRTRRASTPVSRRACSTSTSTEAADVIADVVFRPSLRADDLDLERKVVLEEIAMVEDSPDDIVFELHNEALWGAHPYGYSILGTRETRRRRCRSGPCGRCTQRAYHPSQIVVAASGNIGARRRCSTALRTHRVERRPAGRRRATGGAAARDARPRTNAASSATRSRRTSCSGRPPSRTPIRGAMRSC